MRTLHDVQSDEGAESVSPTLAPPEQEGAVELGGFNLHASVAIAADDDLGRERLMRYGARPPLALERLRRLPGGRLAYRIKKFRVAHWDRLLGGILYAATPRLDWATLLRRLFEVDVLACARCGGRLRVLGEVTEPAAVRVVLEGLGLPTESPRAARARDPTDLLGESADG